MLNQDNVSLIGASISSPDISPIKSVIPRIELPSGVSYAKVHDLTNEGIEVVPARENRCGITFISYMDGVVLYPSIAVPDDPFTAPIGYRLMIKTITLEKDCDTVKLAWSARQHTGNPLQLITIESINKGGNIIHPSSTITPITESELNDVIYNRQRRITDTVENIYQRLRNFC